MVLEGFEHYCEAGERGGKVVVVLKGGESMYKVYINGRIWKRHSSRPFPFSAHALRWYVVIMYISIIAEKFVHKDDKIPI